VSLLGEVHETVSTVTRVRLGASEPGMFEPPPGYAVVTERPPAGE
jgi:hypothetical protein